MKVHISPIAHAVEVIVCGALVAGGAYAFATSRHWIYGVIIIIGALEWPSLRIKEGS